MDSSSTSLATLWLLATLGPRFARPNRKEIEKLSVPEACRNIIAQPELPLRRASGLMYGTTLVHKHNTDTIYRQVNLVKMKLNSANALRRQVQFEESSLTATGPRLNLLLNDDPAFDINVTRQFSFIGLPPPEPAVSRMSFLGNDETLVDDCDDIDLGDPPEFAFDREGGVSPYPISSPPMTPSLNQPPLVSSSRILGSPTSGGLGDLGVPLAPGNLEDPGGNLRGGVQEIPALPDLEIEHHSRQVPTPPPTVPVGARTRTRRRRFHIQYDETISMTLAELRRNRENYLNWTPLAEDFELHGEPDLIGRYASRIERYPQTPRRLSISSVEQARSSASGSIGSSSSVERGRRVSLGSLRSATLEDLAQEEIGLAKEETDFGVEHALLDISVVGDSDDGDESDDGIQTTLLQNVYDSLTVEPRKLSEMYPGGTARSSAAGGFVMLLQLASTERVIITASVSGKSKWDILIPDDIVVTRRSP